VKHLYLKISPFGKMYLGMTKRNPYTYKGSGIDWLLHLKQNNIDSSTVKTTVIYSSENESEFEKVCVNMSDFLNVVCDDRFSNRILESGKMSIAMTEDIRQKKKIATTNLWKNDEYRNNMSGENHPLYGKKRPDTSLMNKKRFENKDERIKLSNLSKERWKDESYRLKMSKLSSGDNNVSKRPEVAKKISETKKRKFKNGEFIPKTKKCISPNGKIYSSVIEAHRLEGIDVQLNSFSRWCRKGTNGWKYHIE